MKNRYKVLKDKRDALTAQRDALLDEVDAMLTGESPPSDEERTAQVGVIRRKQEEARGLAAQRDLVQAQMDEHAADDESRGTLAGQPDVENRTEPETQEPRAQIQVKDRADETKGWRAARYVLAIGRSILFAKRGQFTPAVTIARDAWGEDNPVTRALGTNTLGKGGALMPDTFSGELIELVRPASVFFQLGPTPGVLVNGKLKYPKMTGGASAGWIDQGEKVPLTDATFGQVEDERRKIGCMLPVNNEWLELLPPGVEATVTNDMTTAIALNIDIAAIRSDGTEGYIKGLRYWADSGNFVSFNSTVNLTNTRTDLGKMTLGLRKAMKGRVVRPAWIWGPSAIEYLENLADANGNLVYAAQIDSGRLKRAPFVVCDQMPENLSPGTASEAYHVDMNNIVAALDNDVRVDSSSEASYTVDGAPVSAFEQDQTLIRVIAYAALIARHAKSIMVGTNVLWTP